jgi:hypothetical protein
MKIIVDSLQFTLRGGVWKIENGKAKIEIRRRRVSSGLKPDACQARNVGPEGPTP